MRFLGSLAGLALALAFLAGSGVAQLAGTYVIDGTQPTGGGVYNSFVDAAADLSTVGVSGAVDFIVAPGTYSGFDLTGAYPGMSPANLVRFVATPGTVTLSGVATGTVHVIRLGSASTQGSGPANITLLGLDVMGAPSGSGIMVAGGDNVTVEFCTATSCGAGISFVGTNNSTIQDCMVTGVAQTPGTPGSTSYSGGISAYLNSDNVTIQRNQVISCTGNGIFVGTSGDTTACDNPVIINNIVADCPGLNSYPGGLALRRCPDAICRNNSVSMPASSVNPALNLMVLSSTTVPNMVPQEVSNNVLQHLGTGPCVALNSYGAANPVAPGTFDYNVYDAGPMAYVGGVNLTTGTTTQANYTYYTTLAQWQGVTTPNVVGSELNSLEGPAGFMSPTDLHVLPSTLGLLNGSPSALIMVDVDLQPRPGIPTRGADEPPLNGIFAGFTAGPLSGGAALTVNFTDTSFTNDPSGIFSWAWDFDNDGTTDSTMQNPTWVYLTPGVYSVSLTVTDILNGSNTITRNNYVTVGPYVLNVSTTGGGTGDLSIQPIPNVGAPGASEGYLLISFTTTQPVGTGFMFGIQPDIFTWSTIYVPPAVGSVLHWIYSPGLFPDVALNVPPGSLTSLSGMSADFVQVDLTPILSLANVSNVVRVTF